MKLMPVISLLALLGSFSASADILTFGILGDAGVTGRPIEPVRQSMLKSNVKRMIIPGDNLYDLSLTYAQVWNPWKKLGFTFDLVAIGNHRLSFAEEMSYFKMPAEYFTTVEKNVRFFVLNSDNLDNEKEQATWFDRELKNSKEAMNIVVFHHPPYSITDHHSWTERKEFHQRIRPLLVKYEKKITALIVGHDHLASLLQFNEIPVIVSGAAWETLAGKPVHYEEDGVKVNTRWLYYPDVHWVRLDIDTETKDVWVNFVNAVRDQVSCSVRIAPRPLLYRENCGRLGMIY